MFSRSKFFFFVVFLLFVFPVANVFAQSGGTEGQPTLPPPINENDPGNQGFHVFLPLLSKVVLGTDVAIADVQISPNPAALGDTVHFSFTVTNQGLTPTVEFPVEWKVLPLGETELLASGSFVVPPLVYGQAVVLEADYQALVAGPFDVQVMADPFFENPDPTYANNFRSVELGVTGIVEFCGSVTKDTVWAYATYVVGCNVELPEGINLLVRTGAVVKPTQQSILFNVYGNLELRGTETVPVVITSINDESYGADANGEQTIPPSAGEWNKVFVGSSGVVNASHALLRYGLTPFWSDQGHLQVSDSVLEYFGAATQSNNGFIDLQNNVIRGSGNYGLIYNNNGPFVAAPTMINNHFEACTSYAVIFSSYYEYTLNASQVYGNSASGNGFNGIRLSGIMGGNSILGNAGIPYILDLNQQAGESIYVPAGGSLTIQPGAIFKILPGNFDYALGTGLEIAGTLLAQGTELEPIVFTSIKDDSYGGDTNNDGNATTPAAGDWTRMLIHSEASATFEHVIIRYGGGQLSGQTLESIRCDSEGELHLLSSSITQGGGTGIRIVDGVLDVQDSDISSNTEHGIAYTISSEAAPIIKNSTINNNSAYAIFLSFNEMTLDASQVYGNSATGNGVNGIPLTGTLLGDSIIGQSGIPYVLEVDNDHARSIYVPVGSNLTINAGAVFKVLGNIYPEGRGSGIEIYGTLNAQGTVEEPIVFTSKYDDSVGGDTNNDGFNTTPAKGDWTSNVIQSGGSATFDYVTVRYAGASIYGQTAESIKNDGGSLHFHDGIIDLGAMTGVRSINNGTLDISNSTIQFQNEYGIFYSASGVVAPIIQDNTFNSNANFAVYFAPSGELTLDGSQMSGNTAVNNGTNALRLIGSFAGESTLQNPGFAIFLDYNPDHVFSLYVKTGSTLTIQPGTIFKGYGTSTSEGKGSGIEVVGTLNAVGTSETPIVFTSIKDDTYGGDTNNDGSNTAPAPGQWSMNYIGAGGVATFEHVSLRFAGGSIYGWPLASIRNNGGTLHLSESTVEYGNGSGVRSEASGVIDIHDNLFKSNAEGIFYSASGAVAPIIQDNTFNSNANFAVYFAPSGELTLDGSQISGNTAVNNGTNALRLIGNLIGSSSLQNPGFAILLDYNPDHMLSLYISTGGTLTIQPGTIFKGYGTSYGEGRGSGIEVVGTLNAVGTSENSIVFTSLHDDVYGGDTNNNGSDTVPGPGQWTMNYIGAGGVATFEHTLMRYAGGSIYGWPLASIRNNGGTLHLSESTVEYGNGSGVRSEASGVIDIQTSMFKGNTEYGIYYSASGVVVPVIKNNTFDSNISYAVYFNPFGALTLDGTQMSGNSAVNNGFNTLRLIGALTGSSMLQNPGFAIWLDYNPDHMLSLYVTAGATLTIQPGTIFKGYGTSYSEGRGSGIEVYGSLNAVGTVEAPIVFTSLADDTYGGDTNNDGSNTTPTSGQWTMNYIGAGGVATFEHNLQRYAGGSIYGVPQETIYNVGGTLHLNNSTIEYGSGIGVRSEASGVIDIHDNQIKNNTQYGVYYSASGSVAPIIQNNTFDSNSSYAIYFNPSGALTLDGTKMSGNSAVNNGYNALRLIGALTGSSTLQNPGFAILLDYNPDHVFSLYVTAGSTLTIQPGTIFKGYGTSYSEGRGSGIEVVGTLNAVGTAEAPIVFTSIKDDAYGGDTNNNGSNMVPAPGQWTMNYIGAGGVATFEHTLMRYAGGQIYGWPLASIRNNGGTLHLSNSTVEYGSGSGVRSEASGVIDIHDNLIKSNSEHGIYYSASESVAPIIQNNTFDSNSSFAIFFNPSGSLTLDGMQMSGNTASNNGTNALRLIGNFTGESTLQIPGFAIFLDYNPDHMLSLYVKTGGILTIQPGTIFKGYGTSYSEGKGSGIEVYGTLNSQGTAESPIVFTSIHDDAYGGDTNNNGSNTVPASGQWTMNYIGTGGVATFEHTLMRYAGGSIYGMPQVTIFNSGGVVNLTHGLVDHSANVGILQNSGDLSVTASQVSNNVVGVSIASGSNPVNFIDSDFLANLVGIDFTGNAPVFTQNCIFEGNVSYGFRNQTSLLLDVRNNWWGNASGPAPFGTGDAISGNLIVNPWLTVRPR